jgi:diguanylate cyclase (GGDEF)-like protein/PAS domain S-box-containing protein
MNLAAQSRLFMTDIHAQPEQLRLADADALHRHASNLGVLAGLMVVAGGLVALLGWGLRMETLKSIWPGFMGMKANAAASFLLIGMALAASGFAGRVKGMRLLTLVCAAGVSLMGILTLGEYAFHVDLGIDQLLFREAPGALGSLAPNRMAPAPALNFVLLGAALILSSRCQAPAVAQGLALVAGLLGLLPLMVYTYGASTGYGVAHYTQMAVNTSVLFIVASVGICLLHPKEGLMRVPGANRTGSWLLRRMLPFVIAVPLALGFLETWCQRWGWFDDEGGDAIAMVIVMFLMALLVWGTARALARMDMSRQAAKGELHQAMTSLRQLSRVVEQTAAAVVITDTTGAIEYVNPAFTQLTGYTAEEARRQNPRILKSGLTPPETYADMWRELAAGREWRGELHNRGKTGELFWELATISPLRDAGGNTTHYVAVKENITERKAMEDALRSAARTDKLTGLPNRALFTDRLQQAVLRAQRMKDYRFAVLFLDVDRFKIINDSLGHHVGDLLLQEISRRLRTTVRSGDSLSGRFQEHTTARLGGDEFVVLLDGLSRPDDAAIVARRLLDVLTEPYQLGEHKVYSSASIGIVTSDVVALSAEQTLRDADTAMYEAKLAGKGRFAVFTPAMRHRVQNHMELENDLRKAVDANQLFLVYEPIASLLTGEIERFEVLVRWQHPERGVVCPAEFIPIAEETGLIVPIGEWVLRAACGQLARWRRELGDAAPPSISVNLSRQHLQLANLPDTIRHTLEQTGVPGACLHLEVTESEVMKDVAAAIRTLQAIKAIGVKVDLDDFGTGYSSLACLHQFPIDVIKIDRSFTANIERGRDFAALVHAVAQLARNLNIQVVAEGVETPDQALILQTLDCEFGQGYLFGKPMQAEHIAQLRGHVGLHRETLLTSSGG